MSKMLRRVLTLALLIVSIVAIASPANASTKKKPNDWWWEAHHNVVATGQVTHVEVTHPKASAMDTPGIIYYDRITHCDGTSIVFSYNSGYTEDNRTDSLWQSIKSLFYADHHFGATSQVQLYTGPNFTATRNFRCYSGDTVSNPPNPSQSSGPYSLNIYSCTSSGNNTHVYGLWMDGAQQDLNSLEYGDTNHNTNVGTDYYIKGGGYVITDVPGDPCS